MKGTIAAFSLEAQAGDQVAALIAFVQTPTHGLAERNRAIWALGQIGQFVEPEEPPVRVCVEINGEAGATDPTAELLSRVQPPGGTVGRSACDAGTDRVLHRASGEAAVLISAGPITWEAPDEATVPGRYFRSPSSSALPVYKVVRETEGWVCLGPVIEGLPL